MKTIRKNFLLLAFAFGALFLIGNNVFGSDPTMPEPPPGDQGGGSTGNTATCYSTYTPGGQGFLGIGADPEIWRCGDCIRVRAKNFSDSGICYF